MVIFHARNKYKQNLRTSQGYIFLILRQFATKLCNFTHFKMLFPAMVFRSSCLDQYFAHLWFCGFFLYSANLNTSQVYCSSLLIVSFNSGDGVASNSVVSAQIHPISKETYVFTLCQDYKIRVWSCQVLLSKSHQWPPFCRNVCFCIHLLMAFYEILDSRMCCDKESCWWHSWWYRLTGCHRFAIHLYIATSMRCLWHTRPRKYISFPGSKIQK
jgi:hypothetical protein